MKKTMYVLGSIEIICGLLVFATVDVMKACFPLLGRIAFQAAMAGSYSPDAYSFSSPIAITIAIVFLVIGFMQLIAAFLHKEKE